MALPAPIQAQLDAANATLEQINKPAHPPADLNALAAEPPEPPQEPEPQEPTPPTEPSPEPSPPSPPQPQPPSNDATWEQRFKTLQGLFNAKVPELQGQVKTLESELQQAISRLNAATEATKTPPPDPLQSREHTADVEAFGSDLVEMVQRVIDRKAAPALHEAQTQLQALATRVTQLEDSLKGTSQAVVASAEDRFFDRLTNLVPDWEQINADEAFLAWLAEVDPVYGQPRQAALAAAQQAMDAGRAAAVFKAFASLRQATPKTPPAVDKQVSPKASAATPPPQPANKPILTEKQIAEFYDAKRRGHYRGKEAEAARIEQVINLAIAEGRVV